MHVNFRKVIGVCVFGNNWLKWVRTHDLPRVPRKTYMKSIFLFFLVLHFDHFLCSSYENIKVQIAKYFQDQQNSVIHYCISVTTPIRNHSVDTSIPIFCEWKVLRNSKTCSQMTFFELKLIRHTFPIIRELYKNRRHKSFHANVLWQLWRQFWLLSFSVALFSSWNETMRQVGCWMSHSSKSAFHDKIQLSHFQPFHIPYETLWNVPFI